MSEKTRTSTQSDQSLLCTQVPNLLEQIKDSAVADPEGVQTNPLLSLNYFIFMGTFRKNWSNCTNQTPLS